MKKNGADRVLWRKGGAAALAACLLFAGPYSLALAGEAEGKAKETKKATKKKSEGGAFSKQNPIFITSDSMEADRQKNTIIYKGSVVAVQADMTLRSDKLTTYFDPDLKQITEIIAEGKIVHVTQGDRVTTGTKGVYDGAAQTITMTGNAVARQGNSEVSGERIIFFINEDRAIAESGKNQRVKATIFPEDMQKKKGEDQQGKEK